MKTSGVLLALCSIATASYFRPARDPTVSEGYKSGFENPTITRSVGGHAICIQGIIPVEAAAMNLNLSYTGPANQNALSETMLEYLKANSTMASQIIQPGLVEVSGTYGIYSQLCFPAASGTFNPNGLQFLIHGVGFDRTSWNFQPGFSYVDVAAQAGYTTFSFDRLGNGKSDHPDPIQVVQAPLQVAIAHNLIEKLKGGEIASTTFSNIVGVGHSFGSIQIVVLNAQYPGDLAAAVLTGFSTTGAGMPAFYTALNLSIASSNQPRRFGRLANGSTVVDTMAGNEIAFLHAPNFPQANLVQLENTKGTFSMGELFSIQSIITARPVDFTGPIDVVIGENDLPFCSGNCYYPVNQAEAVNVQLYPVAGSGSQYLVMNGTGHGINLHYSAEMAFDQIQSFVKANGL